MNAADEPSCLFAACRNTCARYPTQLEPSGRSLTPWIPKCIYTAAVCTAPLSSVLPPSRTSLRPTPQPSIPGKAARQMSSKPLLHWDVVVEVMSWLRRSDMAKMSGLCRDLRLAAPKHLLRDDVRLGSLKSFFSLYHFMFADSERRFPLLRQLSLRFFNVDDDSNAELANLVITFFQEATGLQILTIETCDLLDAHDSIRTSFPPLPNLRRLHVQGISGDALEALRRIQAPLRVLEMQNYSYYDGPTDILPSLSAFRHSLHTLDISFVTMSSSEFQFPLVTALRVSYCEHADLSVFQRCFPSLRELCFDSTMDERELDESDFAEMEETRRSNLDVAVTGSWTSLRRVTSTIHSLYMLGLRCHVEYLNARSPSLETTGHCNKLRAVLADLQPICLRITVRVPHLRCSQITEALSPVTGTLAWLGLTVRIHGHRFRDPTPRLRALLASLSAMAALKYIHLKLYWQPLPKSVPVPNEDEEPDDVEDEDDDEDVGLVPPPDPTKVKHFALVDRRRLAKLAARVIPSLQHLCISADGIGTEMFEVQRGEEEDVRTVVQLPWDGRARELYDGPPGYRDEDDYGHSIHLPV